MTCHTPLSRLHLILSDPGVLVSWWVQSPGRLSCSLCINILCFYICCSITQSSPFLLLEKRVHWSQRKGRHSCWNQGENKACIFLWCESLTVLGLFSRDAAFCFSGRWLAPAPCNIQTPPPHWVRVRQVWGSRADKKCRFKCIDLQLRNCFSVCVLLKPNDSLHISFKIGINSLDR